MSTLRATRLNVLDTRNLAAYEPGDHIYPGAPGLGRKDLERSGDIDAAVREVFGGTLRESEFVSVGLSDLIALLQKLPFDEDLANMWDPPMLARLLERMGPRYANRGFLFYRPMRRTKPTLPTGALSGAELRDARNQPGPVLCVFRDDGRGLKTKTSGQEYWYPSLVLPSDMATQLFNTTS
jgi:hypothetical protein